MIYALALAAVGPTGPVLVEAAAAEAPAVVAAVPEREAASCLRRSRAFNYASHALDVATTIRAVDRGATEVGPLARPLLGRRPSTVGLLAFKLVPLVGVRLLDEHFVRRGRVKTACAINIGFGVPSLVAAGLNARYVF